MKQTYDECIAQITWMVIRGITSGQKLENVMSQIFTVVQLWEQQRIAEASKEKS